MCKENYFFICFLLKPTLTHSPLKHIIPLHYFCSRLHSSFLAVVVHFKGSRSEERMLQKQLLLLLERSIRTIAGYTAVAAAAVPDPGRKPKPPKSWMRESSTCVRLGHQYLFCLSYYKNWINPHHTHSSTGKLLRATLPSLPVPC